MPSLPTDGVRGKDSHPFETVNNKSLFATITICIFQLFINTFGIIFAARYLLFAIMDSKLIHSLDLSLVSPGFAVSLYCTMTRNFVDRVKLTVRRIESYQSILDGGLLWRSSSSNSMCQGYIPLQRRRGQNLRFCARKSCHFDDPFH